VRRTMRLIPFISVLRCLRWLFKESSTTSLESQWLTKT
jgi:hypothetical protein